MKHPSHEHPGLKHPGRWLWLFLLAPVIIGVTRLRFDAEIFDLLPSDLPVVEGLDAYQKNFANARQLILTVKSPLSDTTENAARVIAESLRLHSNLVAHATWEPPWLEHPEQAGELMAYLWFNQPPEVFAQLTNRLAPSTLSNTLASTREQLATSLSPEDIARLSYDPFGLTRLPQNVAGAAPSFSQGQQSFASPDGRFRLLFVEANRPLRTYRECQRWLIGVKLIVKRTLASFRGPTQNVAVGYTGRPALVAETAAGMQRDITISVGGTSVIIALLFWLAHRRVKPMLWLLTLLALILVSTLALGGLIYGAINVVSMGFAAILLGLAVDYAVVHYQEALAHPDLTIPQIRHAIAPSIFWAASTTIAAFLVLNFGGLPGLDQLGTLVGLGVALSACIMIFEFLPPLFPGRNAPPPPAASHPSHSIIPSDLIAPEGEPDVRQPPPPVSRARVSSVFALTGALVTFTVIVLIVLGSPPIDSTANALRPRNSPAYAALDQIQANLNQQKQPLWLIVRGRNEAAVADDLAQAQGILRHAVTNHLISGFTLPTPIWPRPQDQARNRAVALKLASEGNLLRQAARANGFAPRSVALAEQMLNTWQAAGESSGAFWPTNELSRWILDKVSAHNAGEYLALGLVNPPAETNGRPASAAGLSRLTAELRAKGMWLSGWELLGHAIFARVQGNMWKVIAPMIALVLVSLWLAFHKKREIFLSLTVLTLSGLCLITVMHFAHWSWNLLNLMAIPLILGTGVDYSIFMQLALRRYQGDLRMAYRSVGRALLLCGGTAIAGFGSLAWSSNAGMASLGRICAIGIAGNMLIAIFLLPVWWHRIVSHTLERVRR